MTQHHPLSPLCRRHHLQISKFQNLCDTAVLNLVLTLMDLLAELELHLLAGLHGPAATAVLVHDAPAVLILDARLPGLALVLRLDSFTVVG